MFVPESSPYDTSMDFVTFCLGSVFGMVIGATLIGVINMGMSIMGIDAN